MITSRLCLIARKKRDIVQVRDAEQSTKRNRVISTAEIEEIKENKLSDDLKAMVVQMNSVLSVV